MQIKIYMWYYTEYSMSHSFMWLKWIHAWQTVKYFILAWGTTSTKVVRFYLTMWSQYSEPHRPKKSCLGSDYSSVACHKSKLLFPLTLISEQSLPWFDISDMKTTITRPFQTCSDDASMLCTILYINYS